jgi:CubicO group peptidase (beta-lactamase class C family)
VLAAAGAAMLLAGCGIRVAEAPSPSPSPGRTATMVASAAASPSATASVLPYVPSAAPSASPLVPLMPAPSASPTVPSAPEAGAAPSAPAVSARRAAALAVAAQRVAAAAAVRRALPTFDQLAASMVARSGVPGAAVAVVAGDTAMYSRCFGLREIGRPDPVDAGTLFQLGGVSQAYTTTLLAALAGEGELHWDQPLRRVWPGFRLKDPWASREATFRDLTAARSGLPAYAGSELRAFGYGRAEILRRLRYLAPAAGFRAVFAPQEALVTAAAVGAERAAGDSWARLLQERVLAPMGDDGTVTGYHGFVTAFDKATPHRLVDGSMVPHDPQDESVFAPSLGVSSSLDQLVTFARLQLNGGALGGVRVAPADLLGQTIRATTAVDVAQTGPRAAGLGWVLSSFDGRQVAAAEGGLASGSSAVISLAPGDGVAVIVLANAYPEGAALGRALTRTLLDLTVFGGARDDWLSREQAAVASAAASPEAAGAAGAGDVPGGSGLTIPAEPPAAAPAPHARRAYAGVYQNEYYGRVTVRPGPGDGLAVRLGRGVTLRYVPWSADIWRDTVSGTAAVFDVRGGRARALKLTLLSFDGRSGAFARAD